MLVLGHNQKARLAWKSINDAVVGSPQHFSISLAERELGVFMHFSKITHLGCQKKRIEEAVAKMQKIARLSISLLTKLSFCNLAFGLLPFLVLKGFI